METTIKILLADDELLFRKGIATMLRHEAYIEVVYEASTGKEIITYLQRNENIPDIILMDIRMPDMNGVEATKIIREMCPDIKIIALSSYDSKAFVSNMITMGAASYLVKNDTVEEMLYTIKEVSKFGFYYNNEILNLLRSHLIKPEMKRHTFYENCDLTAREFKVLELICKQYTVQEIAEELNISKRTVEGYKISLMTKTESKNLAGLVVYAIKNKIFEVF